MSVLAKKINLLPLLLLGALFAGCSPYNDASGQTPSIVGDISEDNSWYSAVDDNRVIEMRISIPTPNDFTCKPYNDLNAPPRPCTLEDVNNDTDPYDDYEPQLHVSFESDEFSSALNPNASMEQKGKSNRLAAQKSYRVKLDSKENLYFGERTFQFNKHYYDDTRMRNKLSFDLFIEIPNFTSLRTRFVNLLIDNNDYGLYTHVEHGDKYYLLNRGWDEDDNLYKAQEFDFFYDPQKYALDEKGNPLHPELFNKAIEIKRGKDQDKFVAMLQELDTSYTDPQKFQTFFEKYFNRENYLTWFAVNIILSNKDTTTQNFFLLNPKGSDTFYFLPWDYDGILQERSILAKWELGYATWWRIPLHRGFLSIKQNRTDLDNKIKELRENYITNTNVNEKLQRYKRLIEPYLTRLPDSDEIYHAQWLSAVESIVPKIEQTLVDYENQKGAPMPFWQSAEYNASTLSLSWDRAVDLEGDTVVYALTIARDINISDVIFSDSNISDTPSLDATNIYYTADINLSPGRYYMQVIAREENNASSYQIAFDTEFDAEGEAHFGVLGFDVR